MGISQSLQRAVTNHPRFHKVQYGTDTDITVVHFQLDNHQYQLWRYKFYQHFPQIKAWQDAEPQLTQQEIKSTYPYLLLVKDKQIRLVRDGFCNEKYKLLIKLNKIWETTLQQQITQRKSIERYFSQEQIWLMILHITMAVLPIHQKSSTSIFGNLHPTNILINVQGELMLISDVSLPGEKDHFATFKKDGTRKSFISPELVGFLTKKSYKEYPNYPSCVNPQKVEAYSLGLIILQLCCTEEDLSKIYNTQSSINYINPQVSRQASSRHNYSNVINQELFGKLMHFMETRYSRMLSMVVKSLLQNRPDDRMSIMELWSALLSEKIGYIQGMDEEWYLQALETIDEFNDGNQQEERRSQYYQGSQEQGYISTGRYENTKGHYRIGSLEWQSIQLEKKTTDSHIREWERSLEKQSIEVEVKKVPKVSFTYL